MFYDNILIYTHLFILQILSTLVSESTGECLVVSRNRFCNTLSFTFSLHFLHFSSLYFFSTLTNFTCYFHTLFSLFILTLSSHSFFPFYFFFSFLNRAISLHLYSLLSCSNFSPRSLTTFVLYFFHLFYYVHLHLRFLILLSQFNFTSIGSYQIRERTTLSESGFLSNEGHKRLWIIGIHFYN